MENVTLEKFDFSTMTENSALVIRTPEPITPGRMTAIWKLIAPKLPKGALILFLKPDQSIEHFNEQKMAEYGWVRNREISGDVAQSGRASA